MKFLLCLITSILQKQRPHNFQFMQNLGYKKSFPHFFFFFTFVALHFQLIWASSLRYPAQYFMKQEGKVSLTLCNGTIVNGGIYRIAKHFCNISL